MLNMNQISSLMAVAEGSVAEFSGFLNFEFFWWKKKNIFFRFCRPILDIFVFTLLNN